MPLQSLVCCGNKTQKYHRNNHSRKSLLEYLCCIKSQTGGVAGFTRSDLSVPTDLVLRYSERPVTIQWSDNPNEQLISDDNNQSSRSCSPSELVDDVKKKSKKEKETKYFWNRKS